MPRGRPHCEAALLSLDASGCSWPRDMDKCCRTGLGRVGQRLAGSQQRSFLAGCPRGGVGVDVRDGWCSGAMVELEKISYGSGVVWPRAQARLGAAYFVWLGWGVLGLGGPTELEAVDEDEGEARTWMWMWVDVDVDVNHQNAAFSHQPDGPPGPPGSSARPGCLCLSLYASLSCPAPNALQAHLPSLAWVRPCSSPAPRLLLASPASCSYSYSSPSGSSSGLLRLRPIFFPFSLFAALHGPPSLHPPTQLAHTPPVALCTLSNLHHHHQRATTIRLTVPPPRFTSTAIFSSFFPFPSLPYSYPPPRSIDHTSATGRSVVVVQSRAVPFSQATSVLWIFVW
ncbi:uncharacterized protein K444DRAFT_714944 [Hyaloscypha bicolor E]|uniref:Uncharacterized protein n=1 Tax=Hyaloscypha bicolor E TaxID=1095630 RepID=A0A2J6TL73_9HELO|nr:uncharacterized protein K444DRAFT_714944 [Hyaloscypha bicolor E]PMD63770.1 hypothetical protein K444DRAFT_714944 [Hyaloscypha bicolor E]